MVTMEDQ